MSAIIVGATIIDAVADKPVLGRTIWIEGGRIKAIEPREQLGTPPATEVIDAHGKYAIPGLMDANVHLWGTTRLEKLAYYEDRYQDVIVEAAQLALKGGLTTVFDTWGPRKALMSVRNRIDDGDVIGSRVFCAGNIIGLDGPLSLDFRAQALA